MTSAAPRIKMSECEIPFHIQEEIMKRLPVKSLVQFRSVSKAWKLLIDSPEFIAAHSLNCHSQPRHLLVWIQDSKAEEPRYVSFIDDDTFPQQRSVPTLPPSVKELELPVVVGSSRGLLCMYTSDLSTTKPAVIWNPSIRKLINVDVPKYSSIGFGVCPVTSDPKIVAITQSHNTYLEFSYPCTVMVYTLSSGKWRSLSTNLSVRPFQDMCPDVTTDGFIYWCVGLPERYTYLSFDVTNESFEVIDISDSLACHDFEDLHMSMVRDSLTVLECKSDICNVWRMEHGVQKSFTKLFTLTTPHNCCIAGFRKNGIPIMHVSDDYLDDYVKMVMFIYHRQKLLFISPTQDTTMFLRFLNRLTPMWIRTWKHYYCSVDPSVSVIEITRYGNIAIWILTCDGLAEIAGVLLVDVRL